MEETMHKEMIDHLMDEIEDACEYLREADKAITEGKEYLAAGLRNAALDEYTHAKFFRNYLIIKHMYPEGELHDHIEEHWHKMCHKFGFE